MIRPTLLTLALAATILSGCAASTADEPEAEVLGETSEALTPAPAPSSCTSATPYSTLNVAAFASDSVTSGYGYGPAGCPNTYLVALNNTQSRDLTISAGWQGPLPSNLIACQQAHVRFTPFWGHFVEHEVFAAGDEVTSTGHWAISYDASTHSFTGRCVIPPASLTTSTSAATNQARIAAIAWSDASPNVVPVSVSYSR